jgi:hypothetical protein
MSPLEALVQGAGPALRISTAAFRNELALSPALRARLSLYVSVVHSQLAQTAACNRFHVVQARMARWLLMTQDRSHAHTFSITHEFLSYMLGVRRVGVTAAATALQGLNLISHERGKMTILDRAGLESAACGCYQADRDAWRRRQRPCNRACQRWRCRPQRCRPRIGHAADVVGLDAAVHLQADVAAAGVNALARRSILRRASR